MILITNNKVNDTLYIDNDSMIVYPMIDDVVTDEMSEEVEEITDFLSEVVEDIFNAFSYEIGRFYKRYPRGMPKSDSAAINWFLYNFYHIMKKYKYYENIAGDFCDAFNSDKDYKLYMFLDNIDFMVYNNDTKEFYIKVEEDNKEPKIMTLSEYKKYNKDTDSWVYNDETFEIRQEIIERSLNKARAKNINKNLVFILIFKFVSTIRNFPMTIIDSKNLKIN